jgi:hypothetical protein
MNVDCNELRLRLIKQWNELIAKLNAGLLTRTIEALDEDVVSGLPIDGDLLVDAFHIAELLGDMRTSIVTLGCSYLPNEPEFRDLSDEFDEVATFIHD